MNLVPREVSKDLENPIAANGTAAPERSPNCKTSWKWSVLHCTATANQDAPTPRDSTHLPNKVWRIAFAFAPANARTHHLSGMSCCCNAFPEGHVWRATIIGEKDRMIRAICARKCSMVREFHARADSHTRPIGTLWPADWREGVGDHHRKSRSHRVQASC